MILLHATVQGEASEEAGDFEGHEIRILTPHKMPDGERELLGRLVDRLRTEED